MVGAEAARVGAGVEDDRRGLKVTALSAALVRRSPPRCCAAMRRHKDATGLLDYDDLIGRAPRPAARSRRRLGGYKLDGGIDHLLLDEVQDTAPEQWQIAEALTEEFFAGRGAHQPDGAPPRSVFAVGDRKQSIYSFQGADVAGFDDARGRLKARVEGGGRQNGSTASWMSHSARHRPGADAGGCGVRPPRSAASGVGPTTCCTTWRRARRARGRRGTMAACAAARRGGATRRGRWPDQNRGLTSAPQRPGRRAGGVDRAARRAAA